MKLLPSLRLPGRRLLFAAICAAATIGALSWTTTRSQAQLDYRTDHILVIYQGELEVGRAYRDRPGPAYTEHYVLFPNYTFDSGRAPVGESIRIVAMPGPGYRNLDDFLGNVPFPKGSRYVISLCREFNRLP
jgi:hypothetical protein